MRVKRQSYGNKLVSSLIGAILGIVLFLGSFVVLYINEGRENIGKVARETTEITQSAEGVENGSLVCIKGNLEATTYANDDYLQADDYVFIHRTVEMYAYVETKHTESKDNVGGSTTTIETFSYEKRWTAFPKTTNTYEGDTTEKPTNIPEDYNTWINEKPSTGTQRATGLSIGSYSVADNITISGSKNLTVTNDVTDLTELDGAVTNSEYIYKSNSGEATPNSPKLGDFRIKYDVVKADDTGMVFGALNANSISSFVTPKNNSLFRFFAEANSREEAISILETEHKVMTWILRLVGWLLMFIGLVAITGPVTKFLSVIPVFSRISGFIFGVAAFFISLVLTTLTVLLSIILHNFWLAMAFVILIVVIIVLVIKKKRQKALENNPQASRR